MQSKILESIGVDPAYILIAMFLILIVLCTFFVNLNMKYNRLKRSYSKFMRGSDGKTLEENIRRHLEKMESIEELSEENQLELRLLREKISGSIQKTGLVQYDAFHEMGGKLSFAFTILDGEDNGWIMNVMHSREGCYIYIKEIVAGECHTELAEEEEESLARAIYGNDEELAGIE